MSRVCLFCKFIFDTILSKHNDYCSDYCFKQKNTPLDDLDLDIPDEDQYHDDAVNQKD